MYLKDENKYEQFQVDIFTYYLYGSCVTFVPLKPLLLMPDRFHFLSSQRKLNFMSITSSDGAPSRSWTQSMYHLYSVLFVSFLIRRLLTQFHHGLVKVAQMFADYDRVHVADAVFAGLHDGHHGETARRPVMAAAEATAGHYGRGAQEQHVFDAFRTPLSLVVPVPVVHPLTAQFESDRCPCRAGHVHVIQEYHKCFTCKADSKKLKKIPVLHLFCS